MSLEERLDVPAAKSDFSTSATLYPREAASRATPAPVIPPPTTTRSNASRSSVASASARGITEGRLRSRPGAAARVPAILARATEVQQPDDVLALTHSDRGATLGRPQHGGRAPVAGEPARVRGEQDDVARDGGRAEVLLVLDWITRFEHRRDHEGGRAVELRARLGSGRLLQAREGLRPDDPEAPWIGEIVVRRPARELEQLVERLPRQRVGRIGLVRAARSDRIVHLHAAR